MGRILTVSIALAIVRLMVGVESFLLSPSALPLRAVPSRLQPQHYSPTLQARSRPLASLLTPSASTNGSRSQHATKRCTSRYRSSRILVLWNSNNFDENENENGSANAGATSSVLVDYVGLACQPVVWISLYSVATTGGGLPAGPGGSIGALEGLSYLVVLILALLPTTSTATSITNGSTETTGDKGGGSFLNIYTLSRITIALGLLILAGLVADQGCVPNAKPILDYSAYLPICSSEY